LGALLPKQAMQIAQGPALLTPVRAHVPWLSPHL